MAGTLHGRVLCPDAIAAAAGLLASDDALALHDTCLDVGPLSPRRRGDSTGGCER